jgi:ribose transport system substrate-binding protein
MRTKRRSGRRNWLYLSSALVVVGLLASAAYASPQTSATQSGSAGPGWQKAKQNYLAATKVPGFINPGPSVDASSLKGKKLWIVLGNGGVPFIVAIANGAKDAATALGMSVKIVDGHGQPANWNRAMQQAVAQNAAGIITTGAPPPLFKAQVAAAAKKHIPVVDTLDLDQTDPLTPGLFAEASISFAKSGALQADYVIAQQKGKATHVLILSDNEFPSEVKRVKGMKAEFKKLAPNISVTVHDVLVSKLATDIPSVTQTELRRDSKIEWVLPTYDAQAVYVVPAIKQANLANKVKVVSSDNVSSNLDWVAKSEVQVFDVGPPDHWIGWAGMDNVVRGILGKPAVKNAHIPLRVFLPSNLKGVDTSNEDALYGAKFRDNYKKLWGIK